MLQPPIAQLLFAVFCIAITINICYLLYFYLRLILKRVEPTASKQQPAVSIIVAAKNEAENLIENLPWLIEQNYPNFEIIVVDDSSWDNTQEVLEAFKIETTKLKIVSLHEDVHKKTGKKFALTLGIKAALNPILIFTDADCKPASLNWVQQIVNQYQNNTEIVIGVGWLEPRGNWLLKFLVYFDTLTTAARYNAFALAGIPYMGVGRNLSYKKESFFKISGFKKHYHIASGDDDLFVNEAANDKNTAVMFAPENLTFSNGPENFTKWWRQKRRHFTTGVYYKTKHKALLFLENFSLILALISFTYLLVERFQPLVLISIISIRYLLLLTIFVVWVKKLKIKNIAFLVVLFEPLWIVIQSTILLVNKIKKPTVWR